MTNTQFKLKMLTLGFTVEQLAKKLNVNADELASTIEKPIIPPLYQWALIGLDLSRNLEKLKEV